MLDRRAFLTMLAAVVARVAMTTDIEVLSRDVAAPADSRKRYLVRGPDGVWGLSLVQAAGDGAVTRVGGIVGIAVGTPRNAGALVAGETAIGVQWTE